MREGSSKIGIARAPVASVPTCIDRQIQQVGQSPGGFVRAGHQAAGQGAKVFQADGAVALRNEVSIDESRVAEFVPSVLVHIRGHVAVGHLQHLLKGLIAQREFVVLLPQVGFEDFRCSKKPLSSRVSGSKSTPQSRGLRNGPGC